MRSFIEITHIILNSYDTCHIIENLIYKCNMIKRIFGNYLRLKTYNCSTFHVNLVYYIIKNHFRHKLLNK